ncbi:MAG: tryptophan--tRNA ligase [Myxococcales bacterium]|nr:tryptophan--tRNA ligase [Myxococcales bacterium]
MSSRSAKTKPRILSGVQPTGQIHLGNYVGALSVWREQQDAYDCLFCVVDLHALTIPEAVDPAVLRRKTREICALYLACGIDPERSTIFVQSEVHEHAELSWMLGCLTPLGWLYRMTQFKTKSEQRESVGTGLLTYPVLQAADILLYQADQVPVGHDQKQHIELARDVAQRFNQMFGGSEEILTVPEVMIRESGARIMGLDDPTAKMSKSTGEVVKGHAVGLLDTPKAIRKAFGRAVTDSGMEFRFEHASPGVVNLMTIYEVFTGQPRPWIEEHFAQKGGYGHLKVEVADVVLAALEPIQARWREIMDDPAYLDGVLDRGADQARQIASGVLAEVKQAMGLGR